jgi:hypothetical protein
VSSCKLISCCLQNALPRVQENPIDRSSMLEVSSVLKIETEVVTIPEKVQNWCRLISSLVTAVTSYARKWRGVDLWIKWLVVRGRWKWLVFGSNFKVRARLDFYFYFFGKQKAKDAFFSITSCKSIRFWVHEWLEFEDLNEHQLFNCKNN